MRNVLSPADFLAAPDRFTLSVSKVLDIVSSLEPAKAVVFVGSKMFEDMSLQQTSSVPLPLPSSLTMTEPIYGTRYQVNN